MTIFLEIVKKTLSERIPKIIEASNAADSNVKNLIAKGINYVCGDLGIGRNGDLAKAKREMAKKLGEDLHKLLEEKTDLATCGSIKKLIDEYQEKGRLLSKSFSQGEGHFKEAMIALKTLVQDIYNNLNDVNLLDVPSNRDAFSRLRFHLADYISEKIVRITWPTTQFHKKIGNEKLELISTTLAECERQLNGIDLQSLDYAKLRQARVNWCIRTLLGENLEVCSKNKFKAAIPLVQFSLFNTGFKTGLTLNTPTYTPSAGLMKVYLEIAYSEINPQAENRSLRYY